MKKVTFKEIEKIYKKETKAWYKHYTKPLSGLSATRLMRAIKKFLVTKGD